MDARDKIASFLWASLQNSLWFEACVSQRGVGAMSEFALTIGDVGAGSVAWVACTSLYKLVHLVVCDVTSPNKLRLRKPLEFVRSVYLLEGYYGRVMQAGAEFHLAQVGLDIDAVHCRGYSPQSKSHLQVDQARAQGKSNPQTESQGQG